MVRFSRVPIVQGVPQQSETPKLSSIPLRPLQTLPHSVPHQYDATGLQQLGRHRCPLRLGSTWFVLFNFSLRHRIRTALVLGTHALACLCRYEGESVAKSELLVRCTTLDAQHRAAFEAHSRLEEAQGEPHCIPAPP